MEPEQSTDPATSPLDTLTAILDAGIADVAASLAADFVTSTAPARAAFVAALTTDHEPTTAEARAAFGALAASLGRASAAPVSPATAATLAGSIGAIVPYMMFAMDQRPAPAPDPLP